jgi:pyridoxine/pyridoxamine 5'-phosphate oxidase
MKVIEMFILNTNDPFDLFNQWFEEAKKKRNQ